MTMLAAKGIQRASICRVVAAGATASLAVRDLNVVCAGKLDRRMLLVKTSGLDCTTQLADGVFCTVPLLNRASCGAIGSRQRRVTSYSI